MPKIDYISDAQELIEKLQGLDREGTYLFRGMPDAKLLLLPGAFREKEIAEYAKQFPHDEKVVHEWIVRAVNHVRNGPNKAVAGTSFYELFRIARLLITKLQYNYAIYKAYLDGKSMFPRDTNDERLLNIFEVAERWAEERIFFDYFNQFHFDAVPLVAIDDGRIIKESYIDEVITGLDQSYPQHYGVKTAALDWTYDPFIALFFTIYTDTTSDESKNLVVCKYRPLIEQNSPVLIQPKANLKHNPRAEAQKGTFIYFQTPCRFYLQEGRFPSVEDCECNLKNNLPKFFELEKLVVPRSKKNIDYIKNILHERGINAQLLLLD